MESLINQELLNLAKKMMRDVFSSPPAAPLEEVRTPQERDENKILCALTDPLVFGNDLAKLREMFKHDAKDFILAVKLWTNDSSQDKTREYWLRETTKKFGRTVLDILDDINPVVRVELEETARWLSCARTPGVDITAKPWLKYGKARCYIDAERDGKKCSFICENGKVRFKNAAAGGRPAWADDVFDALIDALYRKAEAKRIGHYGERGAMFIALAERMIAVPEFRTSDDRLAKALSGMPFSDAARAFGRLSDLGCALLDAAKRWTNIEVDTDEKLVQSETAEKEWRRALLSFSQSVNAAVRKNDGSEEHERMRTLAQYIERNCGEGDIELSVEPQVNYETSRCLVRALRGRYEPIEEERSADLYDGEAEPDEEESPLSERTKFVVYGECAYYVSEDGTQYARPVKGSWDPVRYKPEPWPFGAFTGEDDWKNRMRGRLADAVEMAFAVSEEMKRSKPHAPEPVENNEPECLFR